MEGSLLSKGDLIDVRNKIQAILLKVGINNRIGPPRLSSMGPERIALPSPNFEGKRL